LLALLASGCYQLNVDSGQLRCSPIQNACPRGFYCASDNFCWRTNQSPPGGSPMPPGPQQPTLAAHAASAMTAGGVSAKSEHYKLVMSTALPSGPMAASTHYVSRAGVVGATQGK
jgi:hypothetical protein